MDGYAISGNDIPHSGSKSLEMIGSSFAGSPYSGLCQRDQCVRIMTGAAMPDGTDTVVMQEHVKRVDDTITINADHSIGQNVRQAGEDVSIGASVLPKGKLLTPADIGIISSLGMGEIKVIRQPRVAFFSTGDELRSIGDGIDRPLLTGEIYDSNRYSLHGMCFKILIHRSSSK